MKSASHHAMGHLLYEALTAQGIQLDREIFVLGNLLPVYTDMLRRLVANGAEWVQVDEPCLVLDLSILKRNLKLMTDAMARHPGVVLKFGL